MKKTFKKNNHFFLLFIIALAYFQAIAQSKETVFTIVGDYGCKPSLTSTHPDYAVDVAKMINTWNPEFIISIGDDNYNDKSYCARTIDENVGSYYADYIYPYSGSFQSLNSNLNENKFFSAPGNHDYYEPNNDPVKDIGGHTPYSPAKIAEWEGYFNHPSIHSFAENNASNNERYYSFQKGNIHFFAINSMLDDPDNPSNLFDGLEINGTQYNWLKKELQASKIKDPDAFRIVYMHYGPYGSSLGIFPNSAKTRAKKKTAVWDLKAWGASIVVYGDDHYYERDYINDIQEKNSGLTFITNGMGGMPILGALKKDVWASYAYMHYGPTDSKSLDNNINGTNYYGAIKVVQQPNTDFLHFRYISVKGKVLDNFYLEADGTVTNLIPTNNPKYQSGNAFDYPSPSKMHTAANYDGLGTIKQYTWDKNPIWSYTDENGATQQKSQKMTIAELNLGNNTEYNLELFYNYKNENNPVACEGSNQSGSTANEFTVLSRAAAKKGALFAINGTVLDYNYNCIPGINSTIKSNGKVLSKMQVATYKSEGGIGWNNLSDLTFTPREPISGNNLLYNIDNAYPSVANRNNFMSGMTLMSDNRPYSIDNNRPNFALGFQETSAKNIDFSNLSSQYYYKKTFPSEMLVADGKEMRAATCQATGWEKYYDAETVTALQQYRSKYPFGDCSSVQGSTRNVEDIKYFSSLLYSQYKNYFGNAPYARTFVAIDGNRLDLGVIDGDMYLASNGKSYHTQGMNMPEMSDFYLYKGYDYLINLDGSSSSVFFLNGKGNIQNWKGYTQRKVAEGPYLQRLLQSSLMIVPTQHKDQISAYKDVNNQYLRMDNTFAKRDKSAFISLSPSLETINQAGSGMIAGNFRTNQGADGAVLFSVGTDAYYWVDAKNNLFSNPQDLTIMGVGKIPDKVKQALLKTEQFKATNVENGWSQTMTSYMTDEDYNVVKNQITSNDQAFYYIKVKDVDFDGFVKGEPRVGKLLEYYFITTTENYTDGEWHSFYFNKYTGNNGVITAEVKLDNKVAVNSNVISSLRDKNFTRHTYEYINPLNNAIKETKQIATHAMLGGCNIEGQFVTGDIRLDLDNIIFAIGDDEINNINNTVPDISLSLFNDKSIPNGNYLYNNNVFAFQFEEVNGRHIFALDNTSNPVKSRLYGLKLDAEPFIHPAIDNRLWTASLPTPSSSEILDIGHSSKSVEITKNKWNEGNRLYGGLQEIAMAKIDFSKHNDLELKIHSEFNDPVTGTPLSTPVSHFETCYEYDTENHKWKCDANGKQFNVLSRIIAKEGALVGINGTFYDYNYNCLPGVVSYVKIDGQQKSQPTILSYKNQGALAFDFAKASPDIKFYNNTIEKQSGLSSIYSFITEPNVMSGGQYSYKDSEGRRHPHKFSIPSECSLEPNDVNFYPWVNDPAIASLIPEGGTWLDINPTKYACKIDGSGNPIGTHHYFDCETNQCITQQYKAFQCTQYLQYAKDFGLDRRGRSFIAKKGSDFYMATVGGDVNNKDEWGLTVDQLSQLYIDADYDYMLNLDGGASSFMFVNGLGPVNKIYEAAGTAAGPYFQRLISTALLVVPKKRTELAKSHTLNNLNYLDLDNSKVTNSNKAFLSLSPQIDLFTSDIKNKDGVLAGNFKITETDSDKGAILFSISEDGKYTYKSESNGKGSVKETYENAIVLGVGNMPDKLVEALMKLDNNEEYLAKLTSNKQHVYYLHLQDGAIKHLFTYGTDNDHGWNDGEWHSFYIEKSSSEFKFYVDDVTQIYQAGSLLNDLSLFHLPSATHTMIGGVNVFGRFITGKNRLGIDNLLMIYGNAPSTMPQATLIRKSLKDKAIIPNKDDWFYENSVNVLEFEELYSNDRSYHFFEIADKNMEPSFYGLNVNGIQEKYLHNPVIEDLSGKFYITNDSNHCIKVDKSTEWNAYIDNSGKINSSVCSQVTLEKEPNTLNDYVLSINGDYLDIDSSIPRKMVSLNGQDVLSSELGVVNKKTAVKLYLLSMKSNENTGKAIYSNNAMALPFQFININTILKDEKPDVQEIATSSNHTDIIAVTLAGAGVLGSGGYAVYRLREKIANFFRRNDYQQLNNEQIDVEQIELEDMDPQQIDILYRTPSNLTRRPLHSSLTRRSLDENRFKKVKFCE